MVTLVALFTLPTAWMALGSLSVFAGVAPWLDTALALWMVLPLAIGIWRIARREVTA